MRLAGLAVTLGIVVLLATVAACGGDSGRSAPGERESRRCHLGAPDYVRGAGR